jgi:hypothetical protein
MTTYQFTNLVNIFRDILVRQDWFNNGYRERVLSMSLGELMSSILKLEDGQNVLETVWKTVM